MTPTSGHQVTVTGATSDIQTPYQKNVAVGVVVADSAGSGAAMTLVNRTVRRGRSARW